MRTWSYFNQLLSPSRCLCLSKDAVVIEKTHLHQHPHNDDDMIFTVNLTQCKRCGTFTLDPGLEFRREV